MARIVGAYFTSHVPAIGGAIHRGDQQGGQRSRQVDEQAQQRVEQHAGQGGAEGVVTEAGGG